MGDYEKAGEVPWVMSVDGGGALCERCGDKLSTKLPVAVEAFTRRLRLFIDLHSACEEPKFDCKDLPIVSIDRFGKMTAKDSQQTVHMNHCGHLIPKKGDLPEEPCGRSPNHQGRHARVPSAKLKKKILEAQNANDE